MKLPSDRPEFASFADFYEQDIAPWLHEKEALRKKAFSDAYKVGGLIVGGSLLLLILLPAEVKWQIAIFGGVIAVAVGAWFISRASKEITAGLIGRITGHLGFDYAHDIDRPTYFEVFEALKFFAGFNREHWEDEVRGRYNDLNFVLCESHLKFKSSGKDSSTTTIFHGQLLVMDYPKKFMGTTVLRRDKGMFNRFGKPGKEFQNVGLASAEFERAYEAWSTDQVEARDLLDPIVLERFQELERLFDGKGLQAAFTQGKLLIAVGTGDRLNMGSMFKPLEGEERVETILKEFDVIFDLMDVATKTVTGHLEGALSVDQL